MTVAHRFDLDPLVAVRDLLNCIQSPSHDDQKIPALVHAIDGYVYAVGLLEGQGARPIEKADYEGPERDHATSRKQIEAKFEELHNYWTTLRIEIADGRNGEIAVGDPINDLADISRELFEVLWFYDNYGREEALAALRFRHEHHLRMHIFPLRLYLDEKIWG